MPAGSLFLPLLAKRIFNYVALRTPTKGEPPGIYDRNLKESQRVKGLRFKLSPKESIRGCSQPQP